MKPAIFFLIVTLLLSYKMKAQKSSNSQPPLKRHMCATTIAGISLLPVGTTIAIGGLVLESEAGVKLEKSGLPQVAANEQYARDHREAQTVLKVGIATAVSGLALLIIGGTHDEKRNLKNNVSLISPKINEIGLAYRF